MHGYGRPQIFVMGHPEYDRVTLDGEYKRDKGKGLDIKLPENYYPEDDPDNKPLLLWRAHANNLYTNCSIITFIRLLLMIWMGHRSKAHFKRYSEE